MNPSRRALLASFLAAPVAVRLGRWVKPAPLAFARHRYSCACESVALTASTHVACLRLGFAELMARYELNRLEITRQFVDAACLTSKVPLHA